MMVNPSVRTALLACVLTISAANALAQATPTPAQYHNPVWSPDSHALLFESNRAGRFAIYSIGVDGAGLQRSDLGGGLDIDPFDGVGLDAHGPRDRAPELAGGIRGLSTTLR